MRRGASPFIFIDDFSRGRVHAPGFGRPISPRSNLGYALRLARQSDAAYVPVYCTRIGDQARFKVVFLPEIELAGGGEPDEDLEENIARVDRVLEPVFRRHLDEWFYLLDLDLD
jgi:KDO2-lipid IV(A) lauroyltransferase